MLILTSYTAPEEQRYVVLAHVVALYTSNQTFQRQDGLKTNYLYDETINYLTTISDNVASKFLRQFSPLVGMAVWFTMIRESIHSSGVNASVQSLGGVLVVLALTDAFGRHVFHVKAAPFGPCLPSFVPSLARKIKTALTHVVRRKVVIGSFSCHV